MTVLRSHPGVKEGAPEWLLMKAREIARTYPDEHKYRSKIAPLIDTYALFASAKEQARLETSIAAARRTENARFFSAEQVSLGMSLDHFQAAIPKQPAVDRMVQSEAPEIGTYRVLEHHFNRLDSDSEDGEYSMWFAFQDGSLAGYGPGTVRDVEFAVYRAGLASAMDRGEIGRAEGERRAYEKFVELYGAPAPVVDEFLKYTIFVADKVDRGEATRAEGDYLIAQKRAEITSRMAKGLAEQERVAQERAHQEAELSLARRQLDAEREAAQASLMQSERQMLMNTGMQLLWLNSYQQQQRQPAGYIINPWGRGWIVNPY
jgi:hypothetical protein